MHRIPTFYLLIDFIVFTVTKQLQSLITYTFTIHHQINTTISLKDCTGDGVTLTSSRCLFLEKEDSEQRALCCYWDIRPGSQWWSSQHCCNDLEFLYFSSFFDAYKLIIKKAVFQTFSCFKKMLITHFSEPRKNNEI